MLWTWLVRNAINRSVLPKARSRRPSALRASTVNGPITRVRGNQTRIRSKARERRPCSWTRFVAAQSYPLNDACNLKQFTTRTNHPVIVDPKPRVFIPTTRSPLISKTIHGADSNCSLLTTSLIAVVETISTIRAASRTSIIANMVIHLIRGRLLRSMILRLRASSSIRTWPHSVAYSASSLTGETSSRMCYLHGAAARDPKGVKVWQWLCRIESAS